MRVDGKVVAFDGDGWGGGLLSPKQERAGGPKLKKYKSILLQLDVCGGAIGDGEGLGQDFHVSLVIACITLCLSIYGPN